MATFNSTGGFVSPTQVIDSTGICIVNRGCFESSATTTEPLVLDRYGNRIMVETIKERLNAIRNKSHKDLGEAWSRLAQM